MPDLSLGLDIGTSGLRAAVVDRGARVLAEARSAHRAQDPGASQAVDAEAWWEAARDVIRATLDTMRAAGIDAARLGHMAIDGTSGSMVLTDAALRPVTRALMYDSKGFDAEAARIARHAPNPHVARGAGSALARALRLTSEATPGRVAHLMHQADFVLARLRGRGGDTDVNNALKTGVDPETGEWPDWIEATGLDPAILPRANPAGHPLGPIHPDMASDLGLPAGLVLHAGTTDSIAAFLAAGPPAPGMAVTSLGSTLVIKVLSDRRIEDPAAGLYAHRVLGTWLVGGASNTGGRVLTAQFSPDEIAALSARIDPAADPGLDYYPLPSPGERFPVNDPTLQPRLTPRPQEDAVFLHGLLDGIARIEAQCYDVISAAGGPKPHVILTSGGGAGNPAWTAIRARHLGQTPQPAAATEAAVGAALLPFLYADAVADGRL